MSLNKPTKEELIEKLLEPYINKKINKTLFKNIFSRMKIPDHNLEEIFKIIDRDLSDSLEMHEIFYYFQSQESKLRDLFDSIDEDKNGKITLSELTMALGGLGEDFEIKDDTAKNIMEIFDKNKDGTIDFEEWKDILIFVPHVTLNYAVNWSTQTTASLSFLIDSVPPQLSYETSRDNDSAFMKFVKNFVSGGLAAAISRTLTAPLDRLKMLYQINYKGAAKPPSIITGLQLIVKNDGFRGLFRGNFVNILKASPDSSIKLAIFEFLKTSLKKENELVLSPSKLFIAGSISGVISTFCVYPMDVVKTRIAASPTGTYSGIFDVIKKMSTNEGGIKSFFKGFSAAFSSALPNSGMNLMIYEMMKKAVLSVMNKEKIPIPVFMGIGAFSAAITTTFLYPFNLVSARMIMQGMNNSENSRLGMLQMIKSIYGKEGKIGFYKGFAPTTSKIFLGSGISFGSYEFCKKIFK